MKTGRAVLLSFCGILLVSSPAPAQYWGERVLEKDFEQTDFFFAPSYLMPYGIGSFKGTTAGFVNDPLQEIIVNPSRLGLDSLQDVWLYTDFRGAKTVKEQENFVIPAYITANDTRYASDMAIWPYPRLYLETRREVEPVFSGGVIFRPLSTLVPAFYVGATYQYVLQDSKYYEVPQDIYKTSAGYDFNGRTVAASESIPIVDKYSGKDNMHQSGHFGSVFMRYSPFGSMDLGVKLGRTSFHRDGAYGSANYWDYTSTSSSLWSNIEMRAQSYATWDLAGGITLHPSDRISFGATVGSIWGEAAQALRTGDSSHYDYSSSNYNSFYNRSSNGLYQWIHQGKTWYYGADMLGLLSPTVHLNMYYRHQTSTIDIGLASGVLDTSYSNYASTGQTQSYNGLSRSFFTDARSGGGQQNITTDRAMGSIRWQLSEHLALAVGVQLEVYTMEIKTSEAVLMQNRYGYLSSGDYSYSYQSSQDEAKDLLWTFTSRRTSLQIPVLLTFRTSRYLEFMVAINRDMSEWTIDDMTLALFHYRNRNDNGTIAVTKDFGERYTSPTENVSDVRTTFLGGLSVSPSEHLNVRLLVVPNFSEDAYGQELTQWQIWLGMTITP